MNVTYGDGRNVLDYLLQLFKNKTTTINNLRILDRRTTLLEIHRRMGEITDRFGQIDYLSALITEKYETDKVASAVNTIKSSIGQKQIEIMFSGGTPDWDENDNKSPLCGDWKAYCQNYYSALSAVRYTCMTCKPE